MEVTRRTAFAALATTVAVTRAAAGQDPKKAPLKQSVCRWCYGNMSLEDLCKNAAQIGIQSVELLSENEWEIVRKYNLTCAVANGPGGIVEGWNRVADHDRLVRESERLLPKIAAAKLPCMIVFSGNRRGISDAEGLENCARGLKRIMPLAESLGVTVVMELLNSKRDHRDYQCDHTAWGVELCKRVGSNRFKLLYDIYHMQIMEGDIIQTIQNNIQYIAHFHTGGVPGRNEIDETQELNYARIARAIVDTGFQGYLAHEFIPRRDPMTSLRQAYQICKVA
ncbi:MAG: TIM barrel protein [Chloroherpetonaceae bacterium]|nr:TIM barrel protein [Chthonomonadaceae bacterium]MDW8208643.1 TIM barrel protein [Chloroherpetonaceae bacterium]